METGSHERGPTSAHEHRRVQRIETIGETTVYIEVEPLSVEERALLEGEDVEYPLVKLVSLQAHSSKTKELYDLLELTNPKRVPIFLSEIPLENYHHLRGETEDDSGYILSAPLSDQWGFGVLFHELGHSVQDADPMIRKLKPLYPDDVKVYGGSTDQQKLNLFGNVFQTIDLVPGLEKERDAVEMAFKKQGYVTDLVEENTFLSKRIHELAQEIHERETSILSDVQKDLRSFLPDIQAQVEQILSTDLTENNKPLAAGFIASLQEILEPYGLLIVDEALLKNDIFALLDWMAGRSTSLKPYISISKTADPSDIALYESTGRCGFMIEIRENAQPFQQDWDIYKHRQQLAVTQRSALDELTKEKSDNEHEINRLRREATAVVERVISVPRQTVERDATWRALRWFKYLREIHGIDLLGEYAPDKKNAFFRMLQALGRYKAGVTQANKTFGSVPQLWQKLPSQERGVFDIPCDLAF